MDVPVHERLRLAREARRETRAALAKRTGIGERLLEAIDEGRLADLPSGFYARAAIRRYATAVAIDPDAALAECAALLPIAEDPVAALARLRGLRPAEPAPEPSVSRPSLRAALSSPRICLAREPQSGTVLFPPWRPLAAVAADGALVGSVLSVTVVGAVLLSGSNPSAFGRPAAVVFALLGGVLAACYFVFFGGIAGATAGERLIGMRAGRRTPRHLGPAGVAVRALRCSGRDVRYLMRLGAWAGSALWSGTSGAGREARSVGH